MYLVLVGLCCLCILVQGGWQVLVNLYSCSKLVSSLLQLIKSEISSEHLEKSEETLLLRNSDSARFFLEQSDRVNVTRSDE